MSSNNVNFVKRSQILMCQFEGCWDKSKSIIVNNHHIISNIKPEIGKIRPVVIIYPHKRVKLAIVIPFTTKLPVKDTSNTLYIPIGVMTGVLGSSECWALCDMLQTISINRLKTVYSGNKNDYKRRINQSNSILPIAYFKKIIEKSIKIISSL